MQLLPENKFGRFMMDTGSRSFLKLIASIGNIIATGYLVRHLGQDFFGVYRSATASVSVLALAGGGMSAAAYGLVVKNMAAGNLEAVRKVVSASMRYLVPAGIFIILLAYPVSMLLSSLYKIPQPLVSEFRLTASLAACSLAAGFFAMPLIWLVQARQKEYVLNIIHIPIMIFTPIAIIVSATLLPRAWAPAAALLGVTLLGNLVCIIVSSKMNPWMFYTKEVAEEGVHNRTGYGLGEQFGSVLIGQSLAWSITFHSGPALFGVVVTTMTFFAFLKDMLSTVASTMVAPVGGLFHQQEFDRASLALKDGVILLAYLSSCVAGALICMNGSIIHLWVGWSMYAGSTATFWMASSMIISVIIFPFSAVLYAVDGYRERAFLVLAEGVGGTLFAFIGGGFGGIVGSLAGLVCAQIFLMIFYTYFLRQRLERLQINKIFFEIFQLISVLGVGTFLLWMAVKFINPAQWKSVISMSILGGGFLLIVGWIFALNKDVKFRIYTRIEFLLNKLPISKKSHL